MKQGKPLLYDLFCGAGGASMGYSRAGFRVIGIDNDPKPLRHYPFEFICMDALEFLDRYNAGEFERAQAFHASPPCQGNSDCVNPTLGIAGKLKHKDLITPTRKMLIRTGKPFVLENVPGAPLENYYKLDGTQFGLTTIKERWFETHGFELPMLMIAPFNAKGLVKAGKFAGIMRHGKDSVELTKREHLAAAYEVDWVMNRKELRLAIPPAYTEYIGAYLLAGGER